MSELSTAVAIRDEEHYFLTVREVRSLAERCGTVTEAKDLADRAAAAKVWAERARLGTEQVNLAAVARIWAERRAGELLAALSLNGGDRRSGEVSVSPPPRLKDIGVTYDQSSEWQRMASVPVEEFEAAVQEASEEGVVSRARVMAVHYSSETPEWSTPQDLYDELDAEFSFMLDVCATRENAKCPSFYDLELDGLTQPWVGTCWMNPPYGDQIRFWVAKAHASADEGATVVCLVPARVDTGWWWDHCRYAEIRFLRGRLKFGGGENSAPFPSAVVIFGRPATVVWWDR